MNLFQSKSNPIFRSSSSLFKRSSEMINVSDAVVFPTKCSHEIIVNELNSLIYGPKEKPYAVENQTKFISALACICADIIFDEFKRNKQEKNNLKTI